MYGSEVENSRRGFVKKVAYLTPVVATMSVMPAFATNGSVQAKCNNGVGNGPDCDPPGLINKPELNNDDFGGVPGAPQSQGGTNSAVTTALTKADKKAGK